MVLAVINAMLATLIAVVLPLGASPSHLRRAVVLAATIVRRCRTCKARAFLVALRVIALLVLAPKIGVIVMVLPPMVAKPISSRTRLTVEAAAITATISLE
jgi:hypothetical protein